jgi:hypothetical protein
MNSLAEFLDEPLGRMFWLAVGSVMVFVGLHSLGGAVGFTLAAFALVPYAMMVTGGQPLLRLLRGAN